ncbi:hypothetical protein BHE74_00052288, partial [Ensete ventricosum]
SVPGFCPVGALTKSVSPLAHSPPRRSPLAAAMVGLGFTALLRLAWLAATVPILVVSLPIRPVGFLHRMIMGFAARGKTMMNSSTVSLVS